MNKELSELRGRLTRGLAPLVEEFVRVATGEQEDFIGNSNYAIKEGWEFMKELLTDVDTIDLPGLSNGGISDKVDTVMTAVAAGQLEIGQGKRLIEMLQAGFEMTELKELIVKLAEAGVNVE